MIDEREFLPKVKLKALVSFPADIRAGENITIDRENGVYTINAITPDTGGGEPGGEDTQVQFNDAGEFNGDAAHTFNKGTGEVSVGKLDVLTGQVRTPDAATPTGDGISFNLEVGVGGEVSGRGGSANFMAGDAITNGSGGGVWLQGGYAAGTGTGGNVGMMGGFADAIGFGGDMWLGASDGGYINGCGGRATLQAGNADGLGFGGAVRITSGYGEGTNYNGFDCFGGGIDLISGSAGDVGRGGPIDLICGDGGFVSGQGGPISIIAGDARAAGDGGGIDILAGGSGNTSGVAGYVSVRAGRSFNGSNAGGYVEIIGGLGAGAQPGGAVKITSGSGNSTGRGGDITITPGAGSGGGRNGLIILEKTRLPTTNPGVPGALWLNAGVLAVS